MADPLIPADFPIAWPVQHIASGWTASVFHRHPKRGTVTVKLDRDATLYEGQAAEFDIIIFENT